MHVATLEATPVSFPYLHREVSSQVARDGVTDIIIRVESDDGCVGWGEACSGADAASVEAAIHAMAPFVLGSDPWNREAIQTVLYGHGLWQFRAGTANFAWAGIDMALADMAARAAGLPLYKLFGGLRRQEASYFYYLARGTADELHDQCRSGLAAGYDTFYLKVGVEPAADLAMVEAVRGALGPGPRLRLDANGSWSIPEATRLLAAMAEHDIDLVEQPVRHDPVRHMAELRGRLPMAVCANEGLWSEADAYARIVSRQADVFCFSPYWVGSLGAFQRLSHVAHLEGLQVCKHTHGELGIAAAACHHLRADAAERRRGAPADGADDGGRRARRAAPDRVGASLGRPRGDRPRRRARRRAGRGREPALRARGPVPALPGRAPPGLGQSVTVDQRQLRVAASARAVGGGWAVITGPDSVCYASGHEVPYETGPSPFAGGPTTAFVAPDGVCHLLLANNEPYSGRLDPGARGGVRGIQRRAAAAGLRRSTSRRRARSRASSACPACSRSRPPRSPRRSRRRSPCETVRPIDRELARARMVKTDDEIAALRRASAVADAGQLEARRSARAGRSELELFADIRCAMELAAGGRCCVAGECSSGAERTAALFDWPRRPRARRRRSGDRRPRAARRGLLGRQREHAGRRRPAEPGAASG